MPRPRERPNVGPFKEYDFPKHGENTCLVVPTENDEKLEVLKDCCERWIPKDTFIHICRVKVETGVGKQPYGDDSGLQGARNRIENALKTIHEDADTLEDFRKNKIGTVIVGSIESFIRKPDGEHPATDYGMIVMYNATTRRSNATLTQGATLPAEYFEHAQTFGHEDNEKCYGETTVGEVLAANVDGIKAKDWHLTLVGVPRAHILEQSMKILDSLLEDETSVAVEPPKKAK